MSKKLTTEEFITRSRKVHGFKYDYSKTKYITSIIKVIIGCKIHGDFEQTPSSHFSGSGCFKCGKEISKNKRKLGIDEFIKKSKLKHGNKYDYSNVIYENNRDEVEIVCDIHGLFLQRPDFHMRGSGCPKCSIIKQHEKQKKTLEEFIQESIKIHGKKYDYSKSQYIDNKKPITIICKEHGEFYPTPNNHQKGTGCPKCSLIEQGERQTKTLEEFIRQSKEIHGVLYDYSKVDYEKLDKKVIIICNKHGEFKQTPKVHLGGGGCQKCSYSKGELQISNYLKKHKIEFIPQHIFDDLSFKRKLRCDFYLNIKKIVIEYNGEQHYKPNSFFGGEEGLKKVQESDKLKEDYCIKNNICFEVIRYDENVVERLNQILNV